MPELISVGNITVDINATGIERHPGWAREAGLENAALVWSPITLRMAGNAGTTSYVYARLGGKAKILSAVGKDYHAKFVRHILGEAGVDVSGIKELEGHYTSTNVILNDTEGKRMFVFYPGATMDFTVNDDDLKAVGSGEILLLSGYFLLPALEGEPAIRMLSAAKEKGLTTALDIIPPVMPPRELKDIAALLRHVDIFLPNDQEIMMLTGESDLTTAARQVAECGPKTIVVTMGRQGALVVDGGKVLRVPAYEVEAVNSTGAGDAFNGAFLYGIKRGWKIEESVRFASAVGAYVVSNRDGAMSLPGEAGILKFMSTCKTRDLTG